MGGGNQAVPVSHVLHGLRRERRVRCGLPASAVNPCSMRLGVAIKDSGVRVLATHHSGLPAGSGASLRPRNTEAYVSGSVSRPDVQADGLLLRRLCARRRPDLHEKIRERRPSGRRRADQMCDHMRLRGGGDAGRPSNPLLTAAPRRRSRRCGSARRRPRAGDPGPDGRTSLGLPSRATWRASWRRWVCSKAMTKLTTNGNLEIRCLDGDWSTPRPCGTKCAL